jgi:hypothetical protein
MTAIEHLARALRLDGDSAIATFTAYFDASGTAQTRVITMAGFVSRVQKWERFEREWPKLLPGAVKFFHMTDFVSSQRGWESWKEGHSEKRANLVDNLVACIKRNTNKGFGVSLRLSDYVSFNTEYQLVEAVGGPYPTVGLACLGELRKWATRHRINHTKILCIFEDGDADQGALISRARLDGFNAIPQSKAEIRAFDSCDFAAWKTRAVVDDSLVKELHLKDPTSADRIKKSLDQLDPILQLNAAVDAKVLQDLCNLVGIPKREP